jgi:hypothetical protein
MKPSNRIKHAALLAITAAFCLARAPAAWAVWVFDPPWVADPTNPRWQGGATTMQGWEFANDPHSPWTGVNPYGDPTVQFQNAAPELVTDFPNTTDPIWTWHIGPDGGVVIYCPNFPEPRDFKLIHLQYTSDKASSDAPSSLPPGSVSAGGVAGLGGNWYTYEWFIEIRPNPNEEWIFIPFPESTNIEEIWVSTICVPEPEAWALVAGLGMAVFAVLRRRHLERA